MEIELPQIVKITARMMELGKECPFCEMFWLSTDHERIEYKQLARHALLDHFYEAQEIDNSLIAEMV